MIHLRDTGSAEIRKLDVLFSFRADSLVGLSLQLQDWAIQRQIIMNKKYQQNSTNGNNSNTNAFFDPSCNNGLQCYRSAKQQQVQHSSQEQQVQGFGFRIAFIDRA